jgi:hypothetical protein
LEGHFFRLSQLSLVVSFEFGVQEWSAISDSLIFGLLESLLFFSIGFASLPKAQPADQALVASPEQGTVAESLSSDFRHFDPRLRGKDAAEPTRDQAYIELTTAGWVVWTGVGHEGGRHRAVFEFNKVEVVLAGPTREIIVRWSGLVD